MLTNKTVIITGASSGFGEAIALACAKMGWKVCLGARRVPKLEALCKIISDTTKGSAVFHELDVTCQKSVADFSQFTITHCKQIDGLINNAGLGLGKDFIRDANEKDWQTMYETNVMGVMRITKAFLPLMEKQRYGHIVNIGSIAGHEAYEGGAGYCGTKFALRAFTKALRQETFGKNIRVTSIDPGMAETEFSNVRFSGDTDKAKAVYKDMTPLSAKDIADLVVFALSRPAHVNIDELIVTPTAQVSATRVFRQSKSKY
ncbi:MAG: SDR family NAD(P)-dependent oxidoreductase [Bdellovibrionales bacterium]|nr:SDR family NAD(P)-dependent oxidoreductase [Bdellovibrionales bacterium]